MAALPENALIPLLTSWTPPTAHFLYVNLDTNEKVTSAAHTPPEGHVCWSELCGPSEAPGPEQQLELHVARVWANEPGTQMLERDQCPGFKQEEYSKSLLTENKRPGKNQKSNKPKR